MLKTSNTSAATTSPYAAPAFISGYNTSGNTIISIPSGKIFKGMVKVSGTVNHYIYVGSALLYSSATSIANTTDNTYYMEIVGPQTISGYGFAQGTLFDVGQLYK